MSCKTTCCLDCIRHRKPCPKNDTCLCRKKESASCNRRHEYNLRCVWFRAKKEVRK